MLPNGGEWLGPSAFEYVYVLFIDSDVVRIPLFARYKYHSGGKDYDEEMYFGKRYGVDVKNLDNLVYLYFLVDERGKSAVREFNEVDDYQFNFSGLTSLVSIVNLECTQVEAVGGFELHELARSASPEHLQTTCQLFRCRSLSKIYLNEGLLEISASALAGTNIQTITIPDSVVTIEKYAFAHSALKEVLIPSSVTTIGAGAFGECKSLVYVDVSSSVNALDSSVFSGCNKLRRLILRSPQYVTARNHELDRQMENGWQNDAYVFVPDAIISEYAKNEPSHNNWYPYRSSFLPISSLPYYKFLDVNRSAWYARSVAKMYETALITGLDATTFGVGVQLTRGQLATILWRNAEPNAASSYTGRAENATGMSDVEKNTWYTAAANWAVANGVISGVLNPDGSRSFKPNAPVTFEQMLTILANYVDKAGAARASTAQLAKFKDGARVSNWAKQSVSWAVGKGLVNGNTDGTLRPQTSVTRERAAVVLANALDSGVL